MQANVTKVIQTDRIAYIVVWERDVGVMSLDQDAQIPTTNLLGWWSIHN